MSTAATERLCIGCDRPAPFDPMFEFVGWDYQMVRCPGCGLVFQDPQPSEEVLGASYYQDPEFSRMLLGPLREITHARAREKLPLVSELGLVRPGHRVLDVGCSSGAWLEVMGEVGMRAIGVEVGEQTADDARRRGLDVRTGTLAEVASDLGERFHLITFWDVLEHLRDPREELALAAELLEPGGVVAATFPNVGGWYPRITYRLIGKRTGRWEYPELPVHLYDFSPATARRLFEGAGYQMRSVKTQQTPFKFYRETSLSIQRLGGGRRAWAIRAAYEALRVVVYPAAQVFDRGNAMFAAASIAPLAC